MQEVIDFTDPGVRQDIHKCDLYICGYMFDFGLKPVPGTGL